MGDKVSIYLVDDAGEPLVRVFEEYLGAQFLFALERDIDTKKVIAYLKERSEIHVVLLDIYQDGQPRGIEVLKGIRAAFGEEVQVIMISEKTDAENVVAAVRGGALDYVGRSIYENLDDEDVRSKFANKLLGAWEKANGRRAYRISEESGLTKYGDMIGSCPQIREVHRMIECCAPKDVTVLITGETGTGKELVARRIHDLSDRKKKKFMPQNIAAIPKSGNFLEQTLFGSAPNATGRGEPETKGVFEEADGGTVFLDEIGSAGYDVQTALLRVIQEREVTRLGETNPREVDFRLVCGTNEDLKKAIEDKKEGFRNDLYYRINVINIEMPPLRERGEDIAQLAWQFLEMYNKKFDRKLQIGHDDMNALRTHDWPGNVRELENLIQRSVVLTPQDSSYLIISGLRE